MVLPLAPPGSSWLLLAPPGSSWLLLAPPGSPWLLLDTPGSSCLGLARRGARGVLPSFAFLLALPRIEKGDCAEGQIARGSVEKGTSRHLKLPFTWLLLAPPGSSWLLLAHPGSSWLLLAPPGSSWLLLAPPGSSWLLGNFRIPAGAILEFSGVQFSKPKSGRRTNLFFF